MALKLNRNLDNKKPTKNIRKSEKAYPVCFAVFSRLSVLPNAVLSGLSLSGWSTCITIPSHAHCKRYYLTWRYRPFTQHNVLAGRVPSRSAIDLH